MERRLDLPFGWEEISLFAGGSIKKVVYKDENFKRIKSTRRRINVAKGEK